jgi:hypothetical protein
MSKANMEILLSKDANAEVVNDFIALTEIVGSKVCTFV